MSDREELRRLADAATPGPWRKVSFDKSDYHDPMVYAGLAGGGCFVCALNAGGPGEADASFIAAADPDRVRSLLDRIDALEGALRNVAPCGNCPVCEARGESKKEGDDG